MSVEPATRCLRIGGVTVQPGSAAAVRITLAGSPDAALAVPAWVAVGARTGPRVAVVGASRGFEAAAAEAATTLARDLLPQAISGNLIVVPVLRPGGRFARDGRPVNAWVLPGDAGGNRRERNAFTVFSEVVVGSTLVIILGAPAPAFESLPSVRGDLRDPRVRHAALASGVAVALDAPGPVGSTLRAIASSGIAAIELRGAGSDAAADAMLLGEAIRRVLRALGVVNGGGTAPAPPVVTRRPGWVRAPVGGLLATTTAPGRRVTKGALLARVKTPLGGAAAVRSPAAGLVVEAPAGGRAHGVRAGMRLFRLGPVEGRLPAGFAAAVRSGNAAGDAVTENPGGKLLVGWAERVSLPDLGVERLRAKIDTGARTSALHVIGLRRGQRTAGTGRRCVLEFRIPGGRRGAVSQPVQALVREFAVVRDSSGRSERRPVIETVLRLGPLDRRIRVTLADRGDMLFPMLIGRTALGPTVVVNPSARYLLAPAGLAKVATPRSSKRKLTPDRA